MEAQANIISVEFIFSSDLRQLSMILILELAFSVINKLLKDYRAWTPSQCNDVSLKIFTLSLN